MSVRHVEGNTVLRLFVDEADALRNAPSANWSPIPHPSNLGWLLHDTVSDCQYDATGKIPPENYIPLAKQTHKV